MSYTDEALKAKLSTLNETQDSIVSVSQWIQFFKRHADKIANVWLVRLRDVQPAKRLNFIYLVNDIVQNSRARKRSEFPDAFAPLMPEAVQAAYKSSTPEAQGKIRRVLEVWKTRVTFDPAIIAAIESRIEDVDKAKGGSGTKKTLMGKSLFGASGDSGLPKELESLGPLQTAVTKATIDARPSIDVAQKEYTDLTAEDAVLPTPPVYAARLNGLIKQLAGAEAAVNASIKARQDLVADLQRLLDINKSALAKDEETFLELGSRKTSTEAKKRDVEDAIMRGLSPDPTPGLNGGNMPGFMEDAPEVEQLTPEPEADPTETAGGVAYGEQVAASNPAIALALSGLGEAPSRVRQASGGSLSGPSAKKRKMSHGDDGVVPDLGDMGMGNMGREGETTGSALGDLDADVNELLEQSRGA
ncbi:uncharacterized protein AB675_5217 [Cyphellophora attinorum]|uniref:CID domain-containing protein n=1 Tax=Cyphellophora attinorum TaxID=1664694 RepID=A0A0N1H302_9EURO|nr:uncharacterized protein AB675_5217 [Phialophora attinorum]KPI39222.1 hypothetical protein AB675_5217 [Phialophora attinorum]